ncbi:C39 family peptidase [Oscillospiraceae bacterium 38-13]
MEDRNIHLETRQARRRERRRRQIWRARLLLIAMLVLTAAGLAFLGRETLSLLRRLPQLPDSPIYDMAGPAGGGQGEDARFPLDGETLRALRDLAEQDPRVQEVIDRCEDYPADLVKMLSRNVEMLDFVLEYPEKQGQVFADTIGDVTAGEIPLLLQYDQRWGYGAYGASSVVVSGCGPVCLSMVIAGLTGDNTVTPYDVAEYAAQEGYYVYGAGTAWTLMSRGAAHFGVTGEELPLMKSRMENELREGRPIICVVGPGDFTTSGHFIVITGVRDGKFTVNDPNSTERSGMLWDYETLEPQISNLWAFRPGLA